MNNKFVNRVDGPCICLLIKTATDCIVVLRNLGLSSFSNGEAAEAGSIDDNIYPMNTIKVDLWPG